MVFIYHRYLLIPGLHQRKRNTREKEKRITLVITMLMGYLNKLFAIEYQISISGSYLGQQKSVHIKWHQLTAVHIYTDKNLFLCSSVLCVLYISRTRKADLLRPWNPFETLQTQTLDKNKLFVKRGRVNRSRGDV